MKWLKAGRNLSPHTVAAYRDTFSLLLRWADSRLSIKAESITMDDFTSKNITAFLEHLAIERGNSAHTINCRLAAIHSFCRFAMYRNPQSLDSIRRILEIPRRKTHVDEVDYLTTDDVAAILKACNLKSRDGRETHLMITLLYNTGARISELISLKVCDVTVAGKKGRINFIGKGRKERCLPLWEETVSEIINYIDDMGLGNQDYLFPGRNAEHITRSCARSRIDIVVLRAASAHPQLKTKKISPHMFRHSTAMAMLQAGVDLSTIAIWLGHEQIETTHKYMVADTALKEEASSKVHPADKKMNKRYKAAPNIMSFLESL